MQDTSKGRDFTVLEVCELFRITPPSVYRLLNQGKLDGYTVGRSRRITHESIDRLRKQQAELSRKTASFRARGGYQEAQG